MVVNGGGIVGLSLLAALSSNPHFADRKILLLEQQSGKPQPPPSHSTSASDDELSAAVDNVPVLSNRVTSLTKASKHFYEGLGIWSTDLEERVKKCTSMYVWSQDFRKGITFSSMYPGLFDLLPLPSSSSCSKNPPAIKDNDAVCYFVENPVLQNAINKIVPNKWIRYNASLTDLRADGSDVIVTVGEDERIRTKLLIGCDGYQSLVRRKSTLDYREFPLQQSAIVGTIEMADGIGENEIAFQRFMQDETVIGILPLTRTHSSFVISTSRSKAHMLMQLEDNEFVDAMNTMISMRESASKNPLNNFIKSVDDALTRVLPKPGMPPVSDIPAARNLIPNSRASFPLAFGTTVPAMIGSPRDSKNNKIAVIGDASHRIPPLAGQGLNLGIGDAIELAECLCKPMERGEPVFDNAESLVRALNKFERNRQFKIIPMLAAVAGMQKAFNLTPPSILSQVNNLSNLKNEIFRFANSR
jgi:ubiquinone biosynthesis monooxygenase Coq6